MKYSRLIIAAILPLSLSACFTTPAGPPGPAGATGYTGATGTPGARGAPNGSTIVIVPPAQ